MNKSYLLVIMVTIFLISGCKAQKEKYNYTETKDLPKQFTDGMSKAIPWFNDAVILETDGLSIMYPRNKVSETLYVDMGDFTFSKEKSFFSLTKNEGNREDSIRLDDNKELGRYQKLSYTYFDESGNPAGTAVDFTRDGQIDIKFELNSYKRFIWFKNNWHELLENNGKEFVFINQESVFVKLNGIEYIEKTF